MRHFLIIPHIQVHNANALSSPYTIGFPALTAWLGAVHALQRKLNLRGFDGLVLKSVGVACHDFKLQTYKGIDDRDYSIIGTGNPLTVEGIRPVFIEEARCDLDASLVIEYNGPLSLVERDSFVESLSVAIHSDLKIAGGDILKFDQPYLNAIDDDGAHRKLMRQLMPGYVLIGRRDLVLHAMEHGQDAMDALLDYLKISHRPELDNNDDTQWVTKRKTGGWLVPIATGFHGISELGRAERQRDSETQHRFAESLVTLGEFKMPYRLKTLDEMLWYYQTDLKNNLYLCQQRAR